MAAPAETASLLEHAKEWTLEEFFALPEDQGTRVELIDGGLHVSPAPGRRHQQVLHRIQLGLDAALPGGLGVEPGINVRLNDRRVVIPDLAVVTDPGADGVYAVAENMLLAVEIISPSSRAYDKALKRQLYAEAGVPYYWLVDPASTPPSVIAYRFDGEEYQEHATSRDARLTVDLPFPVSLDLADQGA